MELNIATPTKSLVPQSSSFPRRKREAKGSWKKRHREHAVHRAKEKRLKDNDKRSHPVLAAARNQTDEFSSGLEHTHDHRTSASIKNGNSDASHSGKGARTRLEKLSNVTVEDGGKTTGGVGVNKRPRSSPSHGEDSQRVHQTPDAVKAALRIIHGQPTQTKEADRSPEPAADVVAKALSPDETSPMEKGEEAFAVSSFEDVGLYKSVVHHLSERMGIVAPTKVQERLLRSMLNLTGDEQCVDLLVRSATGSGKTLAYLLPIAHYLLNRQRRVIRKDGALAVIIVPTRELADQVHEVAEKLFKPWHWIVTGSVAGGESKKREKARLRKGINVLVGTPGRLLDHMRNTQSFLYGHCEFLILDEADRLLDLGFEDDVQEIVNNLNTQAEVSNFSAQKCRSNILLSATLCKDVERLAKYSLSDPTEISVQDADGDPTKSFAMPQRLKQHFCIAEQRYRLVTLASFLRLRALKGVPGSDLTQEQNLPACKVIVFFSTCDSVDLHYELLSRTKLPDELCPKSSKSAASTHFVPLSIFRIHGNHLQADRTASLKGFRGSSRAVLLCTDVAARGLDLKGLTFAIQYDPPTGGQGEELEYLHRAGRTARLGARGDALLFLLPSERAYVGKLESKGVEISEISSSAALAALYPRVDLASQEGILFATKLVTSVLQESFESTISEDENLKKMAVNGYQAYCRAYATHAKEVRYFFHVRNLHLGHVARSFGLSEKPVEFGESMAEMRRANPESASEEKRISKTSRESKHKIQIARAIADGEIQPFNDQHTNLARRRREKGRGREAFKELAMEFGS